MASVSSGSKAANRRGRKKDSVGQDASAATRVLAGLAADPNLLMQIDYAARDRTWDPEAFRDEVREKELDFKAETESQIDARIAEDDAIRQRDLEAEQAKDAEKERQISKLKKDLLASDAESFIEGYMGVLIGEKKSAAADEESNQIALAVQTRLMKAVVARNQSTLKELTTKDIRLKYRDMTVDERIEEMEKAHGNEYYAQLAQILKEESLRKFNRSPATKAKKNLLELAHQLSEEGRLSKETDFRQVQAMLRKQSKSSLAQGERQEAGRLQQGVPQKAESPVTLQQKLLGNHDPINSKVGAQKRSEIQDHNVQLLKSPTKMVSQRSQSGGLSKMSTHRSNFQFGTTPLPSQHTMLDQLKKQNQENALGNALPPGFTESFGAIPADANKNEAPRALNVRLDQMQNRLQDLMFNSGFERQLNEPSADTSYSKVREGRGAGIKETWLDEQAQQLQRSIFQDLNEDQYGNPMALHPASLREQQQMLSLKTQAARDSEAVPVSPGSSEPRSTGFLTMENMKPQGASFINGGLDQEEQPTEPAKDESHPVSRDQRGESRSNKNILMYSQPRGIQNIPNPEANDNNTGKAQTLSTLQIESDLKKMDATAPSPLLRNVNTNENLKVHKSQLPQNQALYAEQDMKKGSMETQPGFQVARSIEHAQFQTFDDSRKQLGPVFSRLSPETEKMVLEGSYSSKSKQSNINLDRIIELEQIESNKQKPEKDRSRTNQSVTREKVPGSPTHPTIEVTRIHHGAPMKILDDQVHIYTPAQHGFVVSPQLGAPMHELEEALDPQDQLSRSIALLEDRLKQRSTATPARSYNQSVFHGYLPQQNSKPRTNAYSKYDEFLKADPGFGHLQDKRKLTFKSSHISHVQALLVQRDSYMRRLQEFDCPSTTTDKQSPRIKEQLRKMKESTESLDKAGGPVRPNLHLNVASSLETTILSNLSPSQQMGSGPLVNQDAQKRATPIHSHLGSLPQFLYLSPQNVQDRRDYATRSRDMKAQHSTLSPQDRVYEAHAILLGNPKNQSTFKLDYNQRISKEVLINQVSHQRFKDYLRRLKLVEQTGDLQRAANFGRGNKLNQTHHGSFQAENGLAIDVVAHSRSKMLKEKRAKLKVDDQVAQPQRVAGIALYQQQRLNKDSAAELGSVSFKDINDTARPPAHDQEPRTGQGSDLKPSRQYNMKVYMSTPTSDATSLHLSKHEAVAGAVAKVEHATPKDFTKLKRELMISAEKDSRERVQMQTSMLSNQNISDELKEVVKLDSKMSPEVLNKIKQSSLTPETKESIEVDLRKQQHNAAYSTLGNSALVNVDQQRTEESGKSSNLTATNQQNARHLGQSKRSISKSPNAKRGTSPGRGTIHEARKSIKKSNKHVKRRQMNKDLNGLDQGKQEHKGETSELRPKSQTPVRAHLGNKSSRRDVYDQIFMVDHGANPHSRLMEQSQDLSSKLEQRPSQMESKNYLRPTVIQLRTIEQRKKQASSLQVKLLHTSSSQHDNLNSRERTSSKDDRESRQGRGQSNIQIRPINVPHAQTISTPLHKNSLNHEISDDKDALNQSVRNAKDNSRSGPAEGASLPSKSKASGWSHRSPIEFKDSTMMQRSLNRDPNISSSLSHKHDKAGGPKEAAKHQLLGVDERSEEGLKTSAYPSHTDEKPQTMHSFAARGHTKSKTKGSRGTTPMSNGPDAYYQQQMSTSHFIKQFNKPSFQIQSILKDPSPINYEPGDNVGFFGRGRQRSDKPYVFLPQFSADNPRTVIEQKKKGDAFMQNHIITKFGSSNSRIQRRLRVHSMENTLDQIDKCQTVENFETSNITIEESNVREQPTVEVQIVEHQVRSGPDLNHHDFASEALVNTEKRKESEHEIGIHTAFPVVMPPKRSKNSNKQFTRKKIYQTLNNTQADLINRVLSPSPGASNNISELPMARGFLFQERRSPAPENLRLTGQETSNATMPSERYRVNKELTTTIKPRKGKHLRLTADVDKTLTSQESPKNPSALPSSLQSAGMGSPGVERRKMQLVSPLSDHVASVHFHGIQITRSAQRKYPHIIERSQSLQNSPPAKEKANESSEAPKKLEDEEMKQPGDEQKPLVGQEALSEERLDTTEKKDKSIEKTSTGHAGRTPGLPFEAAGDGGGQSPVGAPSLEPEPRFPFDYVTVPSAVESGGLQLGTAKLGQARLATPKRFSGERATDEASRKNSNAVDEILPTTTIAVEEHQSQDLAHARKYKSNDPRMIYTFAKREKEEQHLQERRKLVQEQKMRAQQSLNMRQNAGSGQLQQQLRNKHSPRLTRQIYFNVLEYR